MRFLVSNDKSTGVNKFLSRRPKDARKIFLRALSGAQVKLRDRSGMQKNGPLKTKVHVLDTTTNIAFCSLLPKYHLQLSFLMGFHQKFTQ